MAREDEDEKKEKTVYYRVITTVIFFSSMCMCVYQTYQLILLYLSDPIETQMKMIMHDAMEFPAVTICNLNPVKRSRWQKKINRSDDGVPQSSSWTQNAKTRKSDRLPRSRFSVNAEQADHTIKLEQYFDDIKEAVKRRAKRQWFINSEKLRSDIEEMKTKLDEIDEILYSHINSTSHNTSLAANNSAIWANLSSTHKRQMKLEERIDDLERRLEVTEVTTSEIAEEMARTRSYLDHLKANMTKTVEETTSNDTVTVTVGEHGEEKLPPSKDLKAFHNYLKDIGEITRDDFRELGEEKEDFIVSCTWQGTICDSSHFEVFQNFMYGNCFTFNTSKVGSHVSGTGPYNGLTLSLFIEQDEYMDRIASAAGARVAIHDFHFKPLPDEEGFSVAPGYTTAISLQKWTTETVKPICDPDIETSAQNGEKYLYSQKGCLKKCLSNEIIRQCRCAGTQFFLDMKTCSVENQTEVECVSRLESLARKNRLPCYCPLPCRTTAYNPIISSASWPAEKYLPSLLEELVRVRHKVLDLFENITDFSQYFRKNFLRINIFFQELKEQEVLQRHSYGIASLLSDIGGQLGLWVGVSVLTLVDFTENVSLFIVTIYRRIKVKCMRKSRRLSIVEEMVRSPFDSPYAIDAKGSCILSPQTSALQSNLSLPITISGLSTKVPHVHFEVP